MHLVITKIPFNPDAHQVLQEAFDRRIPAVLGQNSRWRGAEVSIDPETSTAFVAGPGFTPDPSDLQVALNAGKIASVHG